MATIRNFQETREFLKDKLVCSEPVYENDISPLEMVMHEDENIINVEIGFHIYEFGLNLESKMHEGFLTITDGDEIARLVVYQRIME